TVTAVAAGPEHSCALASGRVYCWGESFAGELGDGTETKSSVPVAVSTAGVLAGKTVTDIAVSGYNTCALASGKVYCWGLSEGLGDGTFMDTSVPVAVSTAGVLASKTVTAISAGYLYACALASGQ